MKEKARSRKKLNDYITKLGDRKLEELWNRYDDPIGHIVDGVAQLTQVMAAGQLGNWMEKSLTHHSYKCFKCENTLVPDCVYKEDEGEGFPQAKTIENQFVCLECGKKYKLVEVKK